MAAIEIDTDNIILHWKSTAKGILTLATAIILAYTALPKDAGRAVVALAVIHATLQAISKDAGTEEAIVDGVKKPVPSHEVPDDPAAEVK